MQFNEIRKELKSIVFDTLRADSDNYFEAVISNDELAKLTASLKRFFGPPVWPSQNELSFKIQETIKDFGGIKIGQTLYFWNEGNDILFAMLWPWQDDWYTTVRIVKK